MLMRFYQKKTINRINKYFYKNKFDVQATKFLKYSILAMKLRENSKFMFTRTLSDLLEIIYLYGRKNHLSRKQLSNFDINEIISSKKKFSKKINQI